MSSKWQFLKLIDVNIYIYTCIYVDIYLFIYFLITNKGRDIVTNNIYVNVFSTHSSDRVTESLDGLYKLAIIKRRLTLVNLRYIDRYKNIAI